MHLNCSKFLSYVLVSPEVRTECMVLKTLRHIKIYKNYIYSEEVKSCICC